MARWKVRYCAAVVAAVACGGGGGGDGGGGIVDAPIVTSVTIGRPNSDAIDIAGTVQLTASVQVQNGAAQTVTWSSSAPNVASVSNSGLVTGGSQGQAVITATSTVNPTKTDAATVVVNAPRIVGVTFNSVGITIRVGENFAAVATVDARGPLARTVSFATSNPGIATVSTADGLTGTITAVGAGQVTITATSTADGTKKATLPVTVTGSVRIPSVTPSPVNLLRNQTVKLVPNVQADPNISTAVTFQSQNNGIATVANDGTVTGVSAGQTSVVVKAVADANVSVTVPVNVRTGVTSVSLTPDRDTLRRGLFHQYTVSVVAEAGVSTGAIMSSADPSIATIDGVGKVTGVGLGQTFIRALSAADPTVGDSTLVVVVDPCVYRQALPLNGTFVSTVSSASCNGTDELFAYQVDTQTTIALAGSYSFPGILLFVGDKTNNAGVNVAANGTGTGFAILPPGRYAAVVRANSAAQRGSFSINTTTNPSLTQTCGVMAGTGILVQAPMNACGFTPAAQTGGPYFSFQFSLLPFIPGGQQVRIRITMPPPIVPVVDFKFSTAAGTQYVGTGQSLDQTIVAPAGGAFASFTVSSKTANQIGNFNIQIDGPPVSSIDPFVFGSGILTRPGRR
jgi:uncharacterized protein YjdB